MFNFQNIKKIVYVLSVLLIIFFLWDTFFATTSYNWFVNFLNSYLNLNIWIIRALAIFIVVIYLFYFLPHFLRALNPLIARKNKIKSIWFSAIYLIAFFLFISPFDIQRNFDNKGNPTKCVAWAIDKYEIIPCDKEVHPKYGTPKIIITKELAQIENFRKVKVNKRTQFFNPATGKPLIYFSKNGNTIDFFNMGGFHPSTGEILLPVTKQEIQNLKLKDEIDWNTNSQLREVENLLQNY